MSFSIHSCFILKIELLNKAVKADERHQYLVAQRYYLQSIEYLIPAIQCKHIYFSTMYIRLKCFCTKADKIIRKIQTVTFIKGFLTQYLLSKHHKHFSLILKTRKAS